MNVFVFFCITGSLLQSVYGSEILSKIVKKKLNEHEIDQLLIEESDYEAPITMPATFIRNRYLIKFSNTSAMNFILNSLAIAVRPFDRFFKIHNKYNIMDSACASMNPLSLRILRSLRQVEFIHGDHTFRIMEETPETCDTETNAEWCLARITDVSVDSNDVFISPGTGGFNVTVYVIDTGIRINHTEFEGRASRGANFVADEIDDDLQGHGTACGSMVGGKRAGVAKKSNLVAVKVLNKDGRGSSSNVISGILWTASQDVKGIVSMSLGGLFDPFINLAVFFAVRQGQFFAAAAGNEASDACLVSPASSTSAFTVAASNRTNTLAWFSNFGRCVDMISPGTKCLLANATTGGFSHASGTSMATPLVAGWAAIYKAYNNSFTPADLANYLIEKSLKDKIEGDLKGTPNRFIHLDCPPQ